MRHYMANGKKVEGTERHSVNGKENTKQRTSRASNSVVDLACTTGQSPGDDSSTTLLQKHFSSKKSAKCRIRVVAVSCTEASDALRRLERIAALLIGKVSPDA